MIGLFVSYDDSSVQEAAALGKKVKNLPNEEFYLGSEERLEFENKELVDQKKATIREKDELQQSLSDSMANAQSLRQKIDGLENQLEAKDDLVRAQKVEPVTSPISVAEKEEKKEDFKETLVKWSLSNTTLVFPLNLQIANDAISPSELNWSGTDPNKSWTNVVRAIRFYRNSMNIRWSHRKTVITFSQRFHWIILISYNWWNRFTRSVKNLWEETLLVCHL